jgi:hypothetical protein
MKKSDVYQESIRFVCGVDELLQQIPKTLAVHNQLDRASSSIPLHIASMTNRLNTEYTPLDLAIRITIRITSRQAKPGMKGG